MSFRFWQKWLAEGRLHSLRIPLGMQLLGEMDGHLCKCIQISLTQKFQEIRFPKGFPQLLKYVLSFFPIKASLRFFLKKVNAVQLVLREQSSTGIRRKKRKGNKAK